MEMRTWSDFSLFYWQLPFMMIDCRHPPSYKILVLLDFMLVPPPRRCTSASCCSPLCFINFICSTYTPLSGGPSGTATPASFISNEKALEQHSNWDNNDDDEKEMDEKGYCDELLNIMLTARRWEALSPLSLSYAITQVASEVGTTLKFCFIAIEKERRDAVTSNVC